LKKLLKKIKNKLKKLKNQAKVFGPANYSKSRYFWFRGHKKLNEKTILLESAKGKIPSDNIGVLLEELAKNPEYKSYTLYLAGNKDICKERKSYLKSKQMDGRVKILNINSVNYYKILATAKYLVTDDAFIYCFTKRKGQVYLNTWHGTPLMTMGKNKKTNYALIGNEQKNFFDADYLLCQSKYAMDTMVEDYMLENFAKAKILLCNAPRNDIFNDSEARERVRTECGFNKKQVIAYMPTWRQNAAFHGPASKATILVEHLKKWDSLLSENQVVYVKQHDTNAVKIDFSRYKNIHPFPENYSTYEFLNAADELVTDYSSVMFDFALTGRKIVLFAYDMEWYQEIRGLHVDLNEFPFPVVETVEELAEELSYPKRYDDTEFIKKFCAVNTKNVAHDLCRRLLLNEVSKLIEEREIPYNGKKNIVIYMGSFEKNGLTTAGANLLHNVDREKNNYAVFYCTTSVLQRQEGTKVVPEDVARIPFYHYRGLTFMELLPLVLWHGLGKLPFKYAKKSAIILGQRNAERMLLNCRVNTVVQFTGYYDDMILTMDQMPCNRIIYLHSDMEKEISHRSNANKSLLSYAYKSYDTVAAVTEGMIPPARRIAESETVGGAKEPNFTLCRNVIDYKRVLTLGEEPITFDSTTLFNVDRNRLLAALASDKKKFVSVGRFSVEKGHARLIKAFERLHKEHPDTCLVIIGGHGDLWDKTIQLVRKSSCPNDIFLVQYMSNPFALIKQCDFFALSSLYEGFGLVLAEADVLGLPCFTVDIDGPRGFMQKYGGLLVENSENGLLAGMQACMDGTIAPRLNIDYEQYNQEAVAQFESII